MSSSLYQLSPRTLVWFLAQSVRWLGGFKKATGFVNRLDGAASLAMLLTVMGNDTRTAHDGLAGVELAEAFRPDLIVLDLGLPKLNGFEACRRIRGRLWARDTLIVAATGWGQDEVRRRSQEAGFDHHLVKPVDAAELNRLLFESKE